MAVEKPAYLKIDQPELGGRPIEKIGGQKNRLCPKMIGSGHWALHKARSASSSQPDNRVQDIRRVNPLSSVPGVIAYDMEDPEHEARQRANVAGAWWCEKSRIKATRYASALARNIGWRIGSGIEKLRTHGGRVHRVFDTRGEPGAVGGAGGHHLRGREINVMEREIRPQSRTTDGLLQSETSQLSLPQSAG